MALTLSALRANLYRIIDQVIETGVPVEIVRKGEKVRIVPEKPVSNLSRIKKRKGLKGDPEDLVTIDWSKEWKGARFP